MASPQIEDKFFRISNELFDALIRYRISGEARQVLDAIIRQTYGYNRTWKDISLSKFRAMTGLKKPNIVRGYKMLITLQIIVINIDNDKSISYRIQKDYTKWKPLSKKITNPKGRPLSKKITNVIIKDNEPLSKKIIPVINIDNATPPKPLQDKASQNPKDNFKDNKERQLKDRVVDNVNNSKKYTDSHSTKYSKKQPSRIGKDLLKELNTQDPDESSNLEPF